MRVKKRKRLCRLCRVGVRLQAFDHSASPILVASRLLNWLGVARCPGCRESTASAGADAHQARLNAARAFMERPKYLPKVDEDLEHQVDELPDEDLERQE